MISHCHVDSRQKDSDSQVLLFSVPAVKCPSTTRTGAHDDVEVGFLFSLDANCIKTFVCFVYSAPEETIRFPE